MSPDDAHVVQRSAHSGEGLDDTLLDRPALDQARAIARGEVSSSELVGAFLRRIADRNERLNAFVTVDAERALREAAEADRRAGAGPVSALHGVPIGIKDLTATRGMRTTFGSRAYADHVPDYDASTVRRIRDAGMIVVGKTNTPEFGSLPLTDSDLFGPCVNPWDVGRNAGGSSGGGAAALAGGLIAIAHGTDAGGSVRNPAAWCGLWGLKPSRGRVSLAPRGERLGGLATEGPIGRSVADVAALLDVMSGYEWGDPYWAPAPDLPFAELSEREPGKLRITVTTESPLGHRIDPECAAAVERTASLLSDLGHDVSSHAFNWETEAIGKSIVAVWEALHAWYDDPDPSLVMEHNRKRVERARRMNAIEHAEARMELERAARTIVRQWESIDLLLTPTVSMTAAPNDFLVGIELEERFARIVEIVSFTRQFNATGQPAISMPVGMSSTGLPIGAQLVGPPAGEAMLLQVARQLERSGAVGSAAHPPSNGAARANDWT